MRGKTLERFAIVYPDGGIDRTMDLTLDEYELLEHYLDLKDDGYMVRLVLEVKEVIYIPIEELMPDVEE